MSSNLPASILARLLVLAKTRGDDYSLLLNRYRHGLDRMGWHADDEPELPPDHPIASLSLGASRSLRFRPHPSPPGRQASQGQQQE